MKKCSDLASARNVHWDKMYRDLTTDPTLPIHDTDVVQKKDLKCLLTTLVDVLQERSSSTDFPTQDANILYKNSLHKKYVMKDVQTDVNNNEEKNRSVDVGLQFGKHLSFENPSAENSSKITSKRSNSIVNNKPSSEVMNSRNQVTRSTETGECTCTSTKSCHVGADCGYFCCGSCIHQPHSIKYATRKQDPVDYSTPLGNNPIQNHLTREIIDTAYMECCVKDIRGCFESWRKDLPVEMYERSDKDKKLQTYSEHLEKCKELLGECGVKNMNGIRVNNMLDHVKGIGKSPRGTWNMSNQLEDQGQPVIEKRRVDSRSNLKYSNDNPELPPISTNSSPLLVTNDQGLVEVHILSLQLATSAAAVLFQEENLCNVSLFISWNIWGQETVCTPCMKCPKLNFNSSFVYHISDLFTFFNCVLSEYLVFQANVAEANATSYAVARAKLCIKDILDYPQNKLHYIAPMNSVISCTLGMNFGQLSLWVRLSCDVELVENFKRQRGLMPVSDQYQAPFQNRMNGAERKDIGGRISGDIGSKDMNGDINDKSFVSLNTMDLEVMENEPIKSPESLQEETTGNREERKADFEDRVSVTEFNSFLSHKKDDDIETSSTIRDVLEVFGEENWDDYKQKSSGVYSKLSKIQKPADTDRDEIDPLTTYPLEEDTIVIEIANVTLFENSSVMRNNDVHLLYVEYSFLGYRGADMETESKPKPKSTKEKLYYRFRKTFKIDEEQHSIERNTLRAMLDQSINPNIKFILVSEPLPEETDSKDCVEVGYAFFNIRKYALGDDNKIITLPIMNQDRSERVGVLQIYVLGLDALRKCLGDDM